MYFYIYTVISPRTWRNISVIIPQIVTSLFVVAVNYNTVDGDISIDDVELKEGACLTEGNPLTKRIYHHFLICGIFFSKWSNLTFNSVNLTDHWNMIWDQFKDPVCDLWLSGCVTLQEQQTILTNVTLSKVSDVGFIMVVYQIFFTILECLERN